VLRDLKQALPTVFRQGNIASIGFGFLLEPVNYFDESLILKLDDFDVP